MAAYVLSLNAYTIIVVVWNKVYKKIKCSYSILGLTAFASVLLCPPLGSTHDMVLGVAETAVCANKVLLV